LTGEKKKRLFAELREGELRERGVNAVRASAPRRLPHSMNE
jgi:hypothetical protein